MKTNHHILVPFTTGNELPPIGKLVKLARGLNTKIHLAGFLPDNKKVDHLMKDTISLMKNINSVLKDVRQNDIEVSSKIYMKTCQRGLNEVVQKEKAAIILTTPNNSEICQEVPEVLHLILSQKEKYHTTHDILILNSIRNNQKERLAAISKIFGDKIFTMNGVGKESSTDVQKFFATPDKPEELEETHDIKEIHEWLKKHDAGLIAMKKEEYQNKSNGKNILQNAETPVLLY